MKTLYILRHAKSSWKDPGLGDFERPLNKRGRRAAKAMARFMTRSGMTPDLILCSAATRTTETLDYLLKRLPSDTKTIIEDALYLASEDELRSKLQAVDHAFQSVMIIGHNPGMADLALSLSGEGSNAEALEDLMIKYPTGALAVLSGPDRWQNFTDRSCLVLDFIKPRSLEEKPNTAREAGA